MDAIFIDAKEVGEEEVRALMFANCFGEKLAKILFVFPRCKCFNTLRRKQRLKGTLYMF